MTLSHPAPRPRPKEPVADPRPGPKQWIKDHRDSVIDAELLKDWPTEAAQAAEAADPAKGARP